MQAGESGYIQVCNKGSTQLERQRLLLNKESQISSFCFPDSSAGKGSTCSAGDPGSIPGPGRSPGEGIGHPLRYSWASLMAQLVKNPPAMRETWVQSLVLRRSPGEGKGYSLQCSGLENPMGCIVNRVAKRRIQLSNFHFHGYHIKEFRAPVGMGRCIRPGLLRSSLS